jgi:hypothetical protein
MRRLALLLPAAVASLTACPGLLGPIELPITLDSPPVDVDVGGPVSDAVDSACEDPTAASCTGIATLCEAEAGAPCNPVTLPAAFPRELDVDEDGTPETTAEELLPTAVTEAARLKVALPADLGGLLADAGVSSAEQVKDVNFDAIQLVWEENSLTFDAPILDVYVGPAVDEGDLLDVDALLANADFEKVGTIGKDLDPEAPGFEVGQVAGVSDAIDLSFVDGGKDAFNARLKSFKFTLLVAAPEGAALSLKPLANDGTKVAAPGGETTLKLKADLVYTVNLGEAAAGLTD